MRAWPEAPARDFHRLRGALLGGRAAAPVPQGRRDAAGVHALLTALRAYYGTAAELWEAAEARGALPAGWAQSPDRVFLPPVRGRLDLAPRFRAEAPTSLEQAAALLADIEGVALAERLAREMAARLQPHEGRVTTVRWVELPPRTVAARLLPAGPRDTETLGAVLTQGLYGLMNPPHRGVANADPAATWELMWRAAVARGATVPGKIAGATRLTKRAFAAYLALVGRPYAELLSPWAPYCALRCLGYHYVGRQRDTVTLATAPMIAE